MDPEKAVRREAPRIASAFREASERSRNEAELRSFKQKELADIKRSLEELL